MVDVILSPSSQTANQYAGGNDGVEDSEHRWMRELTPLVHDLLQRNGIDSQVLWSTDLYTRVVTSNKIGPLLHLPVHSNAGGGTGSGFFIYSRGGKSEIIARALAAAMAPVTPTRDLGVVVYNHYETRATTSPAVIAEVAFHDNATEAQWIRTHLREIAVGLARGVIDGLAAAYGGRFTDIAARPLMLDGGTGMAPIVTAPEPITPTPAAPTEEDDMPKAIRFTAKSKDGAEHIYVAFPNSRTFEYAESLSDLADLEYVLNAQGFATDVWPSLVTNPSAFGSYVGPDETRPVGA